MKQGLMFLLKTFALGKSIYVVLDDWFHRDVHEPDHECQTT